MRNTQFSLLSKILLSALPLLLVAAFAHEASAQELHAQIRGTVVYQSGAIVENADVAATNLETARTASVLSGPDGTFQFLKLAVGVYDPRHLARKSEFNSEFRRGLPDRYAFGQSTLWERVRELLPTRPAIHGVSDGAAGLGLSRRPKLFGFWILGPLRSHRTTRGLCLCA